MKAYFLGPAALLLGLTMRTASALNDEWLKDDQAWLQNQIAQQQAQLNQLNEAKMNANISKAHIALGNGSPSDYANVALYEAQKHQYHQLEHQLGDARTALHKVNNRIAQLGTTRPPQHYGGSSSMENCPPGEYQDKMMSQSHHQQQHQHQSQQYKTQSSHKHSH